MVLAVGAGAQTPAPPPAVQTSPIDCTWLTVDTTARTATLQLIAGLTGLNGALNFNGFKDGGLTFTVPLDWNVVINFTNHDGMLPHSAEIIDSLKPLPVNPVDAAFPRAMTIRLAEGLGPEQKDTFRFVGTKAGSYLVFCGVPGHGAAGMWIRFTVSPSDKRPTLASTAAAGGR
jgi:sulfocyanin